MKNQKGVTLIELMIGLGVMAIIAAIALPSYRALVQNNQLTTTSNEVLGLIQLARSEAIKANRRVYVEADVSPSSGDPHLKVWIDRDSDDTEDTNELTRELRIAADDIDLAAFYEGTTTNWTQFQFAPDGLARTSGEVIRLTLCDSRSEGRFIRVLSSGIVRSGEESACP